MWVPKPSAICPSAAGSRLPGELVQGSAKCQDHLGNIWQSVLQPWFGVEGPAGDRVRALVGTSLEFGTWQGLTQR